MWIDLCEKKRKIFVSDLHHSRHKYGFRLGWYGFPCTKLWPWMFIYIYIYILHIFIVLFLVSSKIAQLAWFSCRLHSFVCQWVFTSKNRHIWGCWSKCGTWSTFSWFRRPPNCTNGLSVLFTLILCNRTTPVSKWHNSLSINWSRLPTNTNLSLSLSLCVSLTHLCLNVYVCVFSWGSDATESSPSEDRSPSHQSTDQ